jgi:hypothetical protein
MTVDPKQFRPSFIKEAPEVDHTPRKCRMCPTMLPKWVQFYCSGFCLNQAKMDGSYGNEA